MMWVQHVPTLKRGRFPGGRYVVRGGMGCTPALEDFVRRREFLEVGERHRVPTHNRMHRVYDFHLPAVGGEVIMKAAWCNPEYPAWRRLEISVSLLVKDRAARAFYAALALLERGVDTCLPLGYWTYRASGLGPPRRYFLAEKIPADFSIKDCRDGGAAVAGTNPGRLFPALIRAAAVMVASMHGQGLRHADLALGNLLVTVDAGSRRAAAGGLPDFAVHVIDVDAVKTRGAPVPIPLVTRLFDLRSLKRLARQLDEKNRRLFLREYLGPDYGPFWWGVFEFWRRHGHGSVGAVCRSLWSGQP